MPTVEADVSLLHASVSITVRDGYLIAKIAKDLHA